MSILSPMSTLVIHPYDPTTEFLTDIYTQFDCTVIRSDVSPNFLKPEIARADEIFFLGHGVPQGLLGFNHLIIDESYVDLLRDKNNVYIWCNANHFVEKHNLSGFATGMIISEVREAQLFNVKASAIDIHVSNRSFAEAVRTGLCRPIMKDCVSHAIAYYGAKNDVADYNRKNIYLYENGVRQEVEPAPLYHTPNSAWKDWWEKEDINASNSETGPYKEGHTG